MKKGVLLLLVLLVPFVSAELLFSQLQESYSFGDQVTSRLTVTADTPQTDFLNVDLACNNETISLYRAPLTLASGEHSVDLNFGVTPALLDDISGQCTLDASYGGQARSSSSFLITRTLIIEASTEKSVYRPDESLKVTGTVRTPNGRNAKGYADLSFAGLTLSVPVNDGRFSLNVTLPHKIAPSEHELELQVYEKDSSGDISNEGTFTQTLRIGEILDTVTVTSSTDELTTGNDLVFTTYAFNQVDAAIDRDIAIELLNPSGQAQFSRLVRSGTEQRFFLPLNATPGNWRVVASVDDVRNEAVISVLEHEIATFEVQNNTLLVTNVGNVPYDESVEISFNNVTVVRAISVPLGASRTFKLSAPDSTYDISVRAGSQEFKTQGVALTGRAIDVGSSGFSGTGVLFIPLVSLVALLAAFLGVRVYVSRRGTGESAFGGFTRDLYSAREARELKPVTRTVNLTSASFSDGEKEQASIVAVAMPQRPQHEEGISLVGDVKASLSAAGAHVVDEGTMLVGLFTKRIAGDDFTQKALKAAAASSEKIQEYNRLARYKVRAGVGVTDGELITGYEGAKLSYASVQNSIGRAKNLAASSNGSLLASETFYKRVMNDVHAERAEKGWKINRVKDNQQHKTFINSFMKRNDFQDSKRRF